MIEQMLLYYTYMLTSIRAYLLDLRVKIWIHCILLPYLFCFYSFFLLNVLEEVLKGFGFSCPYEHPFSPYFEYCFIFFIALIYLRLYISSLIIQNKNYYFFLVAYLLFFILFFICCDWYAHYQLIWNSVDQKYVYNLNFNIFGATFIFLLCLLTFFIFDIFLLLYNLYPLISLIFLVVFITDLIIFDLSCVIILKSFHKVCNELTLLIKNYIKVDCMQSNSDFSFERVPQNLSSAEANCEALPKTILQQAAEYAGDYRYEQKPIECKENKITLRYTQTPEGCKVSIVQCLPDPRLPSSVDSALNNNLPSGFAMRPITEHIVGEPIRTATEVGISSSLELKETRCQEISSILFKTLESYKKK